MIENLVPVGVRCAEVFGDDALVQLFPSEAAHVANAIRERKKEFATVRSCARTALLELGVNAEPLVPSFSGAPTWPHGVVGSMSHCTGYRAAAVGRRTEFSGIGIDAEPNIPLLENVMMSITTPADRHLLRALPRSTRVSWDRVVFCTKEALYKIWSPLTGSWLGFEDAFVEINQNGEVLAHFLNGGISVSGHMVQLVRGRWTASRDLIVVALVLNKVGEAA